MRWMVRTTKGILVGLILWFSVVFTTQIAHAGELPFGVLAVDQAATGADDGTSWEDAYTDLQDALDDAEGDPNIDQIWVAAGANPYLPSKRLDAAEPRSATFSLIEGVALYGGFLGNATGGDESELSERDPETNITILSGDLDEDDGPDPFENNDENAYHVVVADGVDNTAIINGFAITGANANGSGELQRGRGGGMTSIDSTPIIVRCVSFENSAGSATAAGGGAGLRLTSFPAGTDFAFVINCSFIDNRATEEDGPGDAGGRGGGLITGLSRVKVMNCLFDGNETLGDGGSEPGGGGMHVSHDGIVVVTNCTFVQNTSDGVGGGMSIGNTHTNDVTLTNCVFWANTDGGSATVEEEQITVGAQADFEVTYTCIEELIPAGQYDDGMDNIENIGVDPEFVDEINGDFRLIAALSPCVDTANTDAIPPDNGDLNDDGDVFQDTPFDLALDSRLVDGDEDSFDDVDMGAYESVPCPADINGDCLVSAADLVILLAGWGPCGDCGNCSADINDDCTVGAADLLILLADWGPCYCGLTSPLSLEDELALHCLNMDDWDDFEDKMQTGTEPQKENYLCWMLHYLEDCSKCFCTGASGCPGADPFN